MIWEVVGCFGSDLGKFCMMFCVVYERKYGGWWMVVGFVSFL